MKICFLCVEIFAWGKYGGFGRATRTIGQALAKKGMVVTAVVPRRKDQKSIEVLDGITVYGFEPKNLGEAKYYIKKCNADIYHSQEPSMLTVFAQQVMPYKKHVITFRDTRSVYDWWLEFKDASLNKFQVLLNIVFENNWFVHNAIRKADATAAAAKFLVYKSSKLYKLAETPGFLPTPVSIPSNVEKALGPTVCFLARWDRRKKPEKFLELAKSFSHVTFLAVGKSRDPKYDSHLRKSYQHFANIKMTGFVDQFEGTGLSEILGPSWILVNTATREGLPNSFIEAAAHKCAIVSEVDPDGFASQFGYRVRNGDFVSALEHMLYRNAWEARGRRGYEYVSSVFHVDVAIQKHIDLYEYVLRTG